MYYFSYYLKIQKSKIIGAKKKKIIILTTHQIRRRAAFPYCPDLQATISASLSLRTNTMPITINIPKIIFNIIFLSFNVFLHCKYTNIVPN